MKVAVVGSGIAGLGTAWSLSQRSSTGQCHVSDQHSKNYAGKECKGSSECSVTVFEASSSPGMDAASMPIKLQDGSFKRVDVPLRVFSTAYYPNLTELYKTVNVDFGPEDYCASFSDISFHTDKPECFFYYKNWLRNDLSIPFLTWEALRRPSMAILGLEYIRFARVSRRHLQDPASRKVLQAITFKEYLLRGKWSEKFCNDFIVPAVAAMCTCTYDSMLNYPADVVLDYMAKRSMGGVRRAKKGTKEVVDSLLASVDQVNCACPIAAVRAADAERGQMAAVLRQDTKEWEEFDAVVMATPANVTQQILTAGMEHRSDSTGVGSRSASENGTEARLAAILGKFSVENSCVVMHSDHELMPSRDQAWCSVNYVLPPKASVSTPKQAQGSRTMPQATIWMQNAQTGLAFGEDNRNIFQTWNPIQWPNQNLVHGSAWFSRPVVSHDSVTALKDLWQSQGSGNLYVCGSFCLHGMPLLESAVTSGLEVATLLGKRPPWRMPPATKYIELDMSCADQPLDFRFWRPIFYRTALLAGVTYAATHFFWR